VRRKFNGKIVLDFGTCIISVTIDKNIELYWSVCELVKNRLE